MSFYELLIFDFDGTIADSEAVILDTMREGFAMAGVSPLPDAQVRVLIGLDLHEMILILLASHPEFGSADLSSRESKANEITEGYRNKWIAEAHERITLFDGIVPLLEACRGRGQELCIATGKSRIGLERSLDTYDLGRLFTAWATPDQVDKGKPAPDMLELLLSTRPYERSRILMIGDSTLDLDMGHAASIDTCAVAWGTHNEDSLRQSKPRWFVETMADLDKLLGQVR